MAPRTRRTTTSITSNSESKFNSDSDTDSDFNFNPNPQPNSSLTTSKSRFHATLNSAPNPPRNSPPSPSTASSPANANASDTPTLSRLRTRHTSLLTDRNQWRANALKFRDMARDAAEEKAKLSVENGELRAKLGDGDDDDEGLGGKNARLKEELEGLRGRIRDMERVIERHKQGHGVWLGVLGRCGVTVENALCIADRLDAGMEMKKAFEEVMGEYWAGGF